MRRALRLVCARRGPDSVSCTNDENNVAAHGAVFFESLVMRKACEDKSVASACVR